MKYKFLKDMPLCKAGFVFTHPWGWLTNAGIVPAEHPDFFQPVCATCEKPPCGFSKPAKIDCGLCHCAAPKPVVPYPEPTVGVWRNEDYGQWGVVVRLAALVLRNRRNRDANPLKDGKACWFVDIAGNVQVGMFNGKGYATRGWYWSTRAEARAYADLQRALLG
jgi:hypothetical protein